MKLTIKCDWCGKEVKNASKHSGRNSHFFCSRECYKQYRLKQAAVNCDWCGKHFTKKLSDIKRTEHNFCSHECAVNYKRWTGLSAKSPKVNGKPVHRLIAEEIIGRKILPSEEVHHIDFNHSNNLPDNLIILSKAEHSKIHSAEKERDQYGRFTKKR